MMIGLLLLVDAGLSHAQATAPEGNLYALGTDSPNSTVAPAAAFADLPAVPDAALPATAPSAAAPASPAADSEWHLIIAPYLWAPWIHGIVGTTDRNANVSVTPSELFSHFRFGLLGAVEADHKRLLLPLDFLWLRLGENNALPNTPDERTVEVKAQIFVLTPKVGVRLMNSGMFKIDALAGFRYWHLGQSLDFSPPIAGFALSRSQNWVDPLVGGRILLNLSPKIAATIAGDVGGWGAGSQLDYQVVGLLGYRIKPAVALQLGYRYLDVNYRNGGQIFSVAISGLLIGASINLK